jgi:uncharacterized membrane-anchored protein YhcB (DUF1043 family)
MSYRSDEQCEIERLRAENAELRAHIFEMREEIDSWKRGETDILLYPFSEDYSPCRMCKHYASPARNLEPETKTRTKFFGGLIHGHPQRFRRNCEHCGGQYYERTAIDEPK